MNKTKTTPGPWFASALLTADDGWHFATVGPFAVKGKNQHYEDTIAEVSGINHDAKANARLIAAAPDMLTALKEAVRVDAELWRENKMKPSRTMECEESLRMVLAAIAKAEGRSQ